MKSVLTTFVFCFAPGLVAAQNDSIGVDREATVSEVTVTSSSGLRRMGGPVNGVSIGRKELFKAACCNLGESFTTNPSVDVSTTDAATGAKQIKLLGLSGTYVQMLTELLPTFRGAALPYALDYVPGPWMKGIQVSKGTSTVKNGFESMTGQIDIEYLKPDDPEQVNANLYADSESRIEANADANVYLSENLSTILLAHAEKSFRHHDSNDDGFLDMPRRSQFHLTNRWKLVADNYIMHAGLSLLKEERNGGQSSHLHGAAGAEPPLHLYTIDTEADRYEAYMKHAFILRPEREENIALIANTVLHQQDATYGHQLYDINEKNADVQLVYETHFGEAHQLSAGASMQHYHSRQHLSGDRIVSTERPDLRENETTSGAYAQYTLDIGQQLTFMAGLRTDYSTLWHWFVTPRLHVRYSPSDIVTMRASAGKGYRTPHFLAENHFLLASGRDVFYEAPRQEEAWNCGLNMAWNIPFFGRTLKLNAEYYYTYFLNQMVIDRREAADGRPILAIGNLDNGRSYSHTFQVDATYPVVEGLTATAAWRWNDVKCSYADGRHTPPLTSRYKGMFSLSFAPGMKLWQFDTTLQLNGGGRIVGQERFHAYEQLQAQVTREFRHFSVYVGGENLTNRRQHEIIRGYADPWGQDFDATLVWGTVHGPMFYIGLRFNFERI